MAKVRTHDVSKDQVNERDMTVQEEMDRTSRRVLFPTPEAAKQEAADWIDSLMNTLLAPFRPQSEVQSWPTQLADALAIQAGTDTPFNRIIFEGIEAKTGETVADQVTKVIQWSTVSKDAMSIAIGMREVTFAAIDAENDPAKYEGILVQAQADAATAAAALKVKYGL